MRLVHSELTFRDVTSDHLTDRAFR